MPRLHLFEFEDQEWFPSVIRDGMTDYLKYVSNRFGLFQSAVPILERGIAASSTNTVVDLASGGGGPWASLHPPLRESCPPVRVVLTDRYPNKDALSGLAESASSVFEVYPESVDARDVPSELEGLRTMFLSLHHFEPDDVRRILQNAVDAGQPIAAFEAQKRDLPHLIQFSFSPLAVLLMTPLMRPFKWTRFFFTYVVPLIPVFTFWDGLVSVMRTYSATELNELADSVERSESYRWEIGESHSGPFVVPYLLGVPRSVASD